MSIRELEIPMEWSAQDKQFFLLEVRNFYWDEPDLFKYCPNQIMRRCVPNDEIANNVQLALHFLSYIPLRTTIK